MQSVKITKLKDHFKKTYRLTDEQVERMIRSSAASLHESLGSVAEFTDADWENDTEKIMQIAHSLKGLLMNMGESVWAERAREVEQRAEKDEEFDYKSFFQEMKEGLKELWEFT